MPLENAPRSIYDLFFQNYFLILGVMMVPTFWGRWMRYSELDAHSPVWFLSFFDSNMFPFIFFTTLVLGTVFCCLVFFKRSVWFSAGLYLCFTLGIGVLSSYGKVMHGFHGWIYAGPFMLYGQYLQSLKPTTQDDLRYSSKAIIYAQVAAVLPYFLAGLWKVRGFFSCIQDKGYVCISHSMAHTIGNEFSRHGHQLDFISKFFIEHTAFGAVSFVGLIYLQVFSPLFAWRKSLHYFFALGVCLFHIMSALVLKIYFFPTMFLVLYLLLCSPDRSSFSWASIKDLPLVKFINKHIH
jgi:hypothetical protein